MTDPAIASPRARNKTQAWGPLSFLCALSAWFGGDFINAAWAFESETIANVGLVISIVSSLAAVVLGHLHRRGGRPKPPRVSDRLAFIGMGMGYAWLTAKTFNATCRGLAQAILPHVFHMH